MDTSQSEKVPDSAMTIEENAETAKDSIKEIGTPIESPKSEYKDLDSGEFVREEIENVENTLINNNVEILNGVQQVTDGNSHGCQSVDLSKCTLDNSSEVLAGESVKIDQRQTIEILNVELVAPGRDDFVDNVSNSNEELREASVNSENNSHCDIVESADQKQVQNEADPEVMNTVTIDDGVAQITPENQQLANCSDILNSTEQVKTSGLSLLAQYQSDDDSESVVEVPLTTAQDYRSQVFELDSDSDSDDSNSSSDVECLNELRKTIEKRIEVADDDGEDEDQEDCTGKRRPHQKLRVKGELMLEDLPPIQDLQITVPENECIEFGKIHSIVDQLVLVSPLPNSILLDLETVIFLEKGQKVLGEVFDVLGQVADPIYCVRFNSNKQIKEKEIKIGDGVYVAPKTQYTQYIILSNLMKTKGSDASWENDVEPPPRFLDYSDDEQEQLARKQLRNKDRPIDNDDACKRSRTVDNDSMPTSSSYPTSSEHKNRYEHRNSRGIPAGHSNIRPHYNGPQQNQQRGPNHHRSSWHSNYSPQHFSARPPSNFRMHLSQNQPHATQAYRHNMPAYGMPNVHNMTYPSSHPASYGVPPPMYHQHSQQQLMPNTLNIRPPTFYVPHHPDVPQHQQYNSTPPPPPGSL